MYKPAPPRPKKTNIVRTRTGCRGCRERRTKCDEKKPSCSTCMRLGRRCQQFSPRLEFRIVSCPSTATKSQQASSNKTEPPVLNISANPATLSRDQSKRPEIDYNVGSEDKSANLSFNSVANTVPLESNLRFQPSSLSSQASTSELRKRGGFVGCVFRQDGVPLDSCWDLFNSEAPSRFDKTSRSMSALESSLSLPNSLVNMVELDKGENNETSLCIPLTLLPHRDPVQPVMFYMDVWSKQCLPALHSVFTQYQTLPGQPKLIIDTMVALSACRLSRTLPQRKLSNRSNVSRLGFRPDAGHESLSHEHYGAVMRSMARWSLHDFDANPTLALAVLILFCYLESSMGNFQEFRLHSEGTKYLTRTYPESVIHDGGGLLAAWVEVEMQNWWRRVYFSTPDLHRKHSVLSLHPQLEAVLDTSNHQRATILLILCESHCLHNAAIVSCWDARECEDPRIDTEGLHTANFETTDSEKRPSLIDYRVLLKTQSEKLDNWYALLPASDLPEFLEAEGDHLALSPVELGTPPLFFKSHFSAMNFAYYVTARVMQCMGPLDSLGTSPQLDPDDAYQEAEAWIAILLRVAAGIRWKECIRLNVYTVGFAGLLLACVLRSRSLNTGIWMQTWLEGRLKGNEFEEGNFPVFQILEALRLVNCERRNGRDVVSLFQAVDDGGGNGKFGSYHSQLLTSLWVYGRCRATGRLYSYSKAV